MHSSFEAVYRNWSTSSAMVRLLNGWWKSCSPTRSWKTSVADHDRYWNRCQQLKGMLPAKTVGHKTGSSDRNADGENAENCWPRYPSRCRKYYIAAFRHGLIRDGWGQCGTSSPHITHGIWCDDERGKGLLVAPISFDTGYILQKSIAVVLVIYAATIMLKPVADNQIIHFQHHVVAGIWSKVLLGWFLFQVLYSTIIRAVRSRR